MLTKNILTLLVLTCIFGGIVFTSDALDITAEVDKDKVLMGDQIKLEVAADNVKDEEMIFPSEPLDLGDFSLISYGEDPKNKNGMVYVLGIYTTGTHVIPPLKLKYRPSGQTEWNTVETRQISVYVDSVLTGEEKDIRSIKGLLPFGFVISNGMLIGIGIVLLGLFVFFVVRKHIRHAIEMEGFDARLPHEVAYDELRELRAKDLPGKGMIKEHYFSVSAIIRKYLERRFSYRAPEMTTEEFLNSIKLSSELDAEVKKHLRKFLEQCDIVKFAKYGPTPLEILDSYKLAEGIVDRTKVIEAEEEK